MSKIAFVFPGQGAQTVGMGKDVYDNSSVAKEVFDKASEAVGLDLKALCFEENNDINNGIYTGMSINNKRGNHGGIKDPWNKSRCSSRIEPW